MQQQQLDLFNTNDERPLPLIVADKWGFDLAYIERDDDGTLLYSARDWYMGMGGSKNGWTQFQKNWVSRANPVEVEVKRPRRPVEKVLFCDDKALYNIAGNMVLSPKDATKAPLGEIKAYLAKSGALVDEMRRDPDKALDVAASGVMNLDRPDEWKEARLAGVWTRRKFTDELKRVCPDINFGKATNVEYKGLFGKSAGELRDEMGLAKTENVRNHLPASDLHLIGFIETRVAELFKGKDDAPEYECMSVIATISGYVRTLRMMSDNFSLGDGQ